MVSSTACATSCRLSSLQSSCCSKAYVHARCFLQHFTWLASGAGCCRALTATTADNLGARSASSRAEADRGGAPRADEAAENGGFEGQQRHAALATSYQSRDQQVSAAEKRAQAEIDAAQHRFAKDRTALLGSAVHRS